MPVQCVLRLQVLQCVCCDSRLRLHPSPRTWLSSRVLIVSKLASSNWCKGNTSPRRPRHTHNAQASQGPGRLPRWTLYVRYPSRPTTHPPRLGGSASDHPPTLSDHVVPGRRAAPRNFYETTRNHPPLQAGVRPPRSEEPCPTTHPPKSATSYLKYRVHLGKRSGPWTERAHRPFFSLFSLNCYLVTLVGE